MKSGKIWGSTTLIFSTPVMELHRLEVNRGFKCSKHKHRHKFNGFYVERGYIHVHVFKNDYALEDITVLRAGESMVVKPGEYHFFEYPQAPYDGSESYSPAIVYEAYWPELLGEDIIRADVGGLVHGRGEGEPEPDPFFKPVKAITTLTAKGPKRENPKR